MASIKVITPTTIDTLFIKFQLLQFYLKVIECDGYYFHIYLTYKPNGYVIINFKWLEDRIYVIYQEKEQKTIRVLSPLNFFALRISKETKIISKLNSRNENRWARNECHQVLSHGFESAMTGNI